MKLVGRGFWLWAAVLCLGLQGGAQAGEVNAPWSPLPDDAKLVTDPAALTAIFTEHTVRGIHLEKRVPWREYSAADGRTIWEIDGCLHPGTWRVSGSAVCYAYPSWDDGRPQCFMVYQSAQLTHIVWLDPATGEQWLISDITDIAAGNPDQLPLDGAPTCGDPAV